MKIDYKFNEEKLLTEFKEYVDATYDAHYSKEKFQATEFIVDVTRNWVHDRKRNEVRPEIRQEGFRCRR